MSAFHGNLFRAKTIATGLLTFLMIGFSTIVQAESDGFGVKFNFDQGIDVSPVVQEIRQRLLKPIPRASLHEVASIRRGPARNSRYAGVYGPWQPLILNNAPYKQASDLRQDPRYHALDPNTLEPLEAQWGEIQATRSSLLAQTSALEGKDQQLFRDGQVLDQETARLKQRKEALARETAQYNQQCTGHPLPPDQYQYCVQWQASLKQRIAQLNADIDQHNQKIHEWNQQSVAIKQSADALVAAIAAWENWIKNLILRITGLYDAIGNPCLKKCLETCNGAYDIEAAECAKLQTPAERELCYRQAMERYAVCRRRCYDNCPGPAILPIKCQ